MNYHRQPKRNWHYSNELLVFNVQHLFVVGMLLQTFCCTLQGIKNVARNFLQQLLQILTDFDNFCIKLTGNE